MTKRILITGGLGYLGGRMADHLRANAPGADVCLSVRKGKELPDWARVFSTVNMDMRDPASIASGLASAKPDVVIHLAAMSDVESAKDPAAAFDVNTMGTYRILEGARSAGIGRFIYFSTIHVYGPVLSGALSEESPTAPVHPYAITHRAAEDVVNYFRHYHGMKTLVFRMSNGYGYPMDKGVSTWTLIFNDLCRQLVTTGKIVLRSSGKQRRDFIPLSDAGEAVRHFLFSAAEDAWNKLYNLGSGRSISVLEAARAVENIYRAKFGKEPGPLTAAEDAPGAPAASVDYRVDKIMRTGFALKGDIGQEIEKTLEICREFRRK